MRKLLAIILAGLLIASPVFAADSNYIEFTEGEDGKIVYDGDLIDARFMFHEGMVPGDNYEDVLTVKNGSSNDYNVYFQITVADESLNDPRSTGLLDNILMTIELGDENGDNYTEFYNGKARGLDYRSTGVNLSDAVLLKEFAAGEKVSMRVRTYLDTSYEDIPREEAIASLTDWHFYVVDPSYIPPEPEPDVPPVEPIPVVPNPKTNDDFTPMWFVLIGISFVALVAICIYEKSRQPRRR